VRTSSPQDRACGVLYRVYVLTRRRGANEAPTYTHSEGVNLSTLLFAGCCVVLAPSYRAYVSCHSALSLALTCSGFRAGALAVHDAMPPHVFLQSNVLSAKPFTRLPIHP
jgi:hypothetical protein